jgi:RimJ/RimL family protein N-acetyltransferase
LNGPTALRPWRDTDLSSLVSACRDTDIPRWTAVPENYGESGARAFLLHRYDAILAGASAPFAIVAADDDHQLLGSMSLMRFAWEHRRAEVGYWVGREARGHGHATRAVRLICRWGFESLDLERIDLFAATDNPVSQHVAERSGFTREAVLRSYWRGKDMVAFGILRDEVP